MSIAFTSVAVHSKNHGDKYIQQQARLKESILKVYPDATLFFWTDSYPLNSLDWLTSLYGFKVHAINHAKEQRFKQVVYMDTAMILHKPLKIVNAVTAVQDSSKLASVTSDKSLDWFKLKREDLDGKTLVGGSYYYFDFAYPIAREVFHKWKGMEFQGLFGSQDEEAKGLLQGHRHDEACMALSMMVSGIGPMTADQIGYGLDVMTKEHFK